MADPLTSADEKPIGNSPGANTHAYWMKEIHAAEERDKEWRKDAQAAVDLYEGQKRAENSFNVLYSNTETLLPAVYNQLPRPIVDRRYKDEDPLGLNVSQLMKRGLEYSLDTPDDKYSPFNELVEQAVVAALVPGRGVTRFKYDPEMEGPAEGVTAGGGKDPVDQSDATPSSDVVPESAAIPPQAGGGALAPGAPQGGALGPSLADQSHTGADQSYPPEAGGPAMPPEPGVTYESVCGINWPFDRFCHGFARRWSDVPWVAYEHRMTKADIVANFGAGWVERLKPEEEEDDKGDTRTLSKDKKGAPKAAVVYEVWQKSKKKVIFVGRDYKEGVIKAIDDPLNLPGFFDCPRPLKFVNRNANLVPVVPYKLYEEQAKELNRVTQRINKIISALKVRGFYNGQIKDLNDLMTMEENRLAPANTNAVLAEAGGLDKHIWLMPLEKLIQVLQQLYIQREQVKQVIYEITGISDILRGSSVASETATAQNIKNQWGTLRLKKMQKMAADYVRSCMRIQAAIMGNHFSQETWAKMTGLKYPTRAEKAQAQQMVSQFQAMMAAQQPNQAPPGGQLSPPPGGPSGPPGASPAGPPAPGPGAPQAGGPPAPPPIPPQVQAKLQQAQDVANAPFTWEDLLAVMKDNFQRGYKIDVETNSTVDTDATEDKQNITDLLTAISQALQAFMPMVEQGQMPMGVVKAILGTICRRFNFGPELEKQLASMPDQAPQKPDPAMQKAQADMETAKMQAQMDMQKGQQELELAKQTAQMDMQAKMMDMQVKQKEMENKMALMDKEMQIKQEELGLQQQELQMKVQELGLKDRENQQKLELNGIVHQGKMETAALKNAQMKQAASQPPAPRAQ